MRHIAVSGFATAPCNGLVEEVLRPAASPSNPNPAGPLHRSLPIVNAVGQVTNTFDPTVPIMTWVCGGCGKVWDREPLPDETL